MTTLIYPSSADLMLIAPELLDDVTMNDPVFDICPVVERDVDVLLWEQFDSVTGLMAGRGLDGLPSAVQRLNLNQYSAIPGAFGEYEIIPERYLTSARSAGTFATAVNLNEPVMQAQRQLMNRAVKRVKQTIWSLLGTGTYTITNLANAVIAKDSYTFRTFSASVAWSTPGTSTPLNDFRQMQLLQVGHSVSFGANAKAFMNRKTLNNLLNNTNSADLFGRRVTGLATPNSLQAVNSLLAGDDLPQIVVYEGGYLPDGGGSFIRHIPDNTVIVVGVRDDGAKIMDYGLTRNANRPDLGPGFYAKVVDNGEDDVPRVIKTHTGFNGGPEVFYPLAIIKATV